MSHFDDLCAKQGLDLPSIKAARECADQRVEQIRGILQVNHIDLSDTLSLVVFGSLARREATSQSDVDWTLLVDGPVDPYHFETANRIRRGLADASLIQPGSSGTFGTLASSHDIVHQIGGSEDTNRNMTRRLLLLLESRAIGGEIVRSRVVRAVLDRYISWGRGLRSGDPRLRVPRFLLNDVVRYWRTMAVDYAAKKWEQADKNWALRNAKLRVTRKMTFVKGLLLCFDCELFSHREPWSTLQLSREATESAASMACAWNDLEQSLVSGSEKLVELTPIDVLSRVLSNLDQPELGQSILTQYDQFLQFIDNDGQRRHLEGLSFEQAPNDELFQNVRDIGEQFGDGLTKLFFESHAELTALTRKHGVF